MADSVEELREWVVLSQRILGMFGIYQEDIERFTNRFRSGPPQIAAANYARSFYVKLFEVHGGAKIDILH